MTLSQHNGDILIVDDVKANINVLRHLLTNHGYRIRAAINGDIALHTSRHLPPDIILLDIGMPGMDGFEVCAELKKDPRLCDIPIIFLSARDDIQDKIRAFDIGGIDYITKPFHHKEVLARVKSHIALRQANKQLQQEIFEREKAQKALQDAKDAAEYANQAKSDFLSKMSHDIRTPMNAIIGFCDILLTEIENDQQLDHLRAIQTSGQALLSLINDILDVSKIESGKMQLYPEAISLHKIFNEIYDLFSLQTKQRNLDFQVSLSQEIPRYLLLDKTRIRQILYNLVGNAIKFTSEGSIRLFCHGQRKKETIDLFFEIDDTGIGIAAEYQGKIFDAFMQSDNMNIKQYGGTGLGLTITKQLVEMMQGSIRIDSVPNRGTKFFVALQDIIIPEGQGTSMVQDEESIIFEPALIIVADDVHLNRQLIKHYFAGSAVKVLTASNGLEAIDLLAQKPDLILMDIQMPMLDGYETIYRIRKMEPPMSVIPIVALTAYALTEEQDKIRQAGFNGTLVKPIQRYALFKEMAKFLNHSLEKESLTHDTDFNHIVIEANNSDEFFYTVLVVDDIPVNRSLLRSYLQKQKHIRILEADNGKQAVAMALKHQPNLILMDIKMPVMDGFEATRQIRQAPSSINKVSIVALTASVSAKDQLDSHLGFNGYLVKPIDNNELNRVLAHYLFREP